MAVLFIGVNVCVPMSWYKFLGVFKKKKRKYILAEGSRGGASRCCFNNLPAVLYPLWRPGLERELNIYPLHVKIILKIANRCRTAVCRTCTRTAGAVAARECARGRNRKAARERKKS